VFVFFLMYLSPNGDLVLYFVNIYKSLKLEVIPRFLEKAKNSKFA